MTDKGGRKGIIKTEESSGSTVFRVSSVRAPVLLLL